jgi:hypothetical protein
MKNETYNDKTMKRPFITVRLISFKEMNERRKICESTKAQN